MGEERDHLQTQAGRDAAVKIALGTVHADAGEIAERSVDRYDETVDPAEIGRSFPNFDFLCRESPTCPDVFPTKGQKALAPFSRTEDGDFLAEAAIEVRSSSQAKATASLMEGEGKGAVAFSKTGDPQLGEWEDAIILG
jgi:hypothetical protein